MKSAIKSKKEKQRKNKKMKKKVSLGISTLKWHGQAPEHVEGEEQRSPSGLATLILAFPSPQACRGGREAS
jgi:hypothetical protein